MEEDGAMHEGGAFRAMHSGDVCVGKTEARAARQRQDMTKTEARQRLLQQDRGKTEAQRARQRQEHKAGRERGSVMGSRKGGPWE